MKTAIRDLINRSGKRSVVDYDHTVKRVDRSETLAQKKMDLIKSVIGDRTKDVAKALSK